MASSTKMRQEHRGVIHLAAVVLAVILPYGWIVFSDARTRTSDFLNFHPLAMVFYVPLAFGLIWPILIGFFVLGDKLAHLDYKWPKKTALIMFIIAAVCSRPFIRFEYRNYTSKVNAIDEKERPWNKMDPLYQADKRKALSTLRSHGISALADPLSQSQTEAMDIYLDRQPIASRELESATRHYRTSYGFMEHVSAQRDCPSQVLQIIYDNIVELQKQSRLLDAHTEITLINIAKNINATQLLLSEMENNKQISPLVRGDIESRPDPPEKILIRSIETGSPDVFYEVERANVPESVKVAYVQKMANSSDLHLREWAAENVRCPTQDLERLAANPSTEMFAASNPKLPMDVLEKLTKSKNKKTRDAALKNLAERHESLSQAHKPQIAICVAKSCSK